MSAQPQTQAESQTISELMSQLTEQATRLARQEVELAKLEMTEKGRRLGVGAGAFGGAGLLATLALGTLTAAIVLILATAMEAWLAAAIVTVAYLAVAGVLALVGREKVQQGTPPAPEQAIESVRDDVQETKESFKEGRR
jgi:uncharacterized membrane protein YqjE